MGEVANSSSQFSILQITGFSAENPEESRLLVTKLSGAEAFDLTAALKSLPWVFAKQSDPTILRVWKECLEAAGFRAEVVAAIPPARGRRRKEKAPIFSQDAAYPQLLPLELTRQMRSLSQTLPSASLKLAFAETAEFAMNLLERIYKKQSERVLFVDYVFHIEESLREFITKFATGKISTPSFERQNNKLLESFRHMESEMDSVREQVQNQL
jgi:hypothetical protein